MSSFVVDRYEGGKFSMDELVSGETKILGRRMKNWKIRGFVVLFIVFVVLISKVSNFSDEFNVGSIRRR